MDRPAWIDDPAWNSDAARLAQIDDMVAEIEAWLQRFPDIESAVERLEQFDVPCAPVLSVAQTVHHPHHRQRGTVRRVHDRLHGDVDLPGFPIKFRHLPNHTELEAPTLGEHNRAVLSDLLGQSDAEIEALHAAGILVEKEI